MDIRNMSPAGQGNYQKVMQGMPVVDELEKMTLDPMKYNEELLFDIIRTNRDTEFGKKYGFDQIRTIEDFQRKVPVSRFDDYKEAIMRMTENGEENILCADPIRHYNKSSGTTGTPKRIPMSEQAIRVFNKYTLKYLYGVLGKELEGDWYDGKQLSLAESATFIQTLKCGASYGAVSVKTVLQFRPYLQMMFTSPDEATFPEPDTNTRYLHARFGLMEKNVTSSGASFFSFYAELLRYIEHNWELLVHDIETGKIDPSIKMSDEVRKGLEARLSPMPERAQELREIFSRGFAEPFVPKVWPRMRYIVGVGTAGFKVYADTIRNKYTGPGIRQFKVGLTASEGLLSVPFALDSDDSVLVPDSVFYEFLPLDAGDDFSRIVTMDKLEEGKDYEIIITNCSGFYRYRMRDAVRVTGMHNHTPTIQFLYRIDQNVSIMGEKTTEIALRAAAVDTAKEIGFELVDFTMYPDLEASPVRYVYYMEIDNLPEGVRPKEIRYCLEQNLAKTNPSMGEKVKKGICGPTKLSILESETYMLYRDLMLSKGVASSQLKPVRVINNENQKKFFRALTDYSTEGMQ